MRPWMILLLTVVLRFGTTIFKAVHIVGACLVLSSACAFAWPVQTNSITVKIGEQAAVRFPIPQGESRVLEALYRNGTNAADLIGMTAEYLYRTPDVETWYTAPATVYSNGVGAVRVSWGPAYDKGAPAYLGWVRMLSGSNPIYRVKVDLAMIPTPGFTPNATLLTVAPVDLATLSYTNEPWATPATIAASGAVWRAEWQAADAIDRAAASNLFLRVYDSGGGVWKHLLPGEVTP